jgi:hypothetical protein
MKKEVSWVAYGFSCLLFIEIQKTNKEMQAMTFTCILCTKTEFTSFSMIPQRQHGIKSVY